MKRKKKRARRICWNGTGRGGLIMGFFRYFSTLVNSAVDHAEKTIEEQQRKNEIARQKNGELGVHRRTDAEPEMDGSGSFYFQQRADSTCKDLDCQPVVVKGADAGCDTQT